MGNGRQLSMAISAALAGIAWGYMRSRNHPRVTALALLQGLDWFVASGGAAALIERARAELLGETNDEAGSGAIEEIERVTHARHVVSEEPAD